MSLERRQTIGRQPFEVLFESDPYKSEKKRRTFQEFLQTTSINERKNFIDQGSCNGKQRQLFDTKCEELRSVVTLRHEQKIINFPIYDEDEVGINSRFANTLVSAGNDDDDHATSDTIRNYFIQLCKKQLYEGIVMNIDESRSISKCNQIQKKNFDYQLDIFSQTLSQSNDGDIDKQSQNSDRENTNPIQ